MPKPNTILPKPESDYRLFVDGSYKDGFIGCGVLVLPGYQEYCDGQPGQNSTQAEMQAVELAITKVPDNSHCIIYTDLISLIELINQREFSEQHLRQIEARYMSDQSPHHRRAHELASKGREWAMNGRQKKKRPCQS